MGRHKKSVVLNTAGSIESVSNTNSFSEIIKNNQLGVYDRSSLTAITYGVIQGDPTSKICMWKGMDAGKELMVNYPYAIGVVDETNMLALIRVLGSAYLVVKDTSEIKGSIVDLISKNELLTGIRLKYGELGVSNYTEDARKHSELVTKTSKIDNFDKVSQNISTSTTPVNPQGETEAYNKLTNTEIAGVEMIPDDETDQVFKSND